jgi:hypothetical protein
MDWERELAPKEGLVQVGQSHWLRFAYIHEMATSMERTVERQEWVGKIETGEANHVDIKTGEKNAKRRGESNHYFADGGEGRMHAIDQIAVHGSD